MSNKNIPAIPAPTTDPVALATTVVQLKAGMEILAGVRGAPLGRAVTLQDLVDLGLIARRDALFVA